MRDVPMPPAMVKKIKPVIDGLPEGRIFRIRGRDLMTKNSSRRMWESIVMQLHQLLGYNPNAKKDRTEPQITGLTARIFRHNYCTELCCRGPEISTKMIAHLMGDTEKVVLDVYSHMIAEADADASEVIADTLLRRRA